MAQLGATPIDYTVNDFTEFTGQFDLILDTVGGGAFTRSLPLLAPHGRIVTCPDPSHIDSARESGVDAHWVFVHPDATELTAIADALVDGSLRVYIDEVFPFAQLPEAHRRGETGHVRG